MTDEITNAIEIARNDAPLTRRGSTRAITKRKAKSPIAIIIDRNITHRAISRLGEVALCEMLGTANWGAGPGLGPTA